MRTWSVACGVLTAALLGCGDDGSGSNAADSSTTDAPPPSTGAVTTSGSIATDDGDGTTTSSDDTDTGAPLEGYDDPDLWLCHPDKDPTTDECLRNDLSATEILPDGSTQLVEHVVAEAPEYDCFYVYPTVDIRLTPGQTENFNDISQELDPLLNQAARFTAQCRMFAPLYHQVTIGTFGSPDAQMFLDAAYQDVADAFASYLEHHAGDRPFVLMGHSQGTYMLTRLLQEQIETDDALRQRLIVALMIGGAISVADGEERGGTFSTLPLCTTAAQTGCVLAHRTYAAELPPDQDGQPSSPRGAHGACVDPGALTGATRLSAYLPTFTNQPAVFPPIDFGRTFDTPFVLLRDLYAGTCQTDPDGNDYFALTVEPARGDLRQNPVDFEHPLLTPDFLGLHVFDYNFPLGELMALVAEKAAAMP